MTYFLNSNDEDTLKELSESLGKKEVKKISKSTSYDSRSKGSTSGTTENIEEKPLMSVSEIKSKNKDLAIISIIGYKPMLIKTKLAYKHFTNDNYVHQCDETSSEITKWSLSNLTNSEAQDSVSEDIEQSEDIDKETEINEEVRQKNDLYSIALDIVNRFD
nr:TraM recognition domain-containing protein [Mycoplasmopsis agalactiae]